MNIKLTPKTRHNRMALVDTRNATHREKSLFHQSLSGLVKNLETRYTTIDLRNECCVTGQITKVDGFMNIEMEDVVFYDMRGNQKSLTNFFVNARNIRDIIMPKNTEAMSLLKAQLESMTRKSVKANRGFKTSRAIKKTAETVREAYSEHGKE
ncbi:U7 snRNA-associated Sm-like protein LSm10 isoform X2 [Euwallacea fornicatus]|uniref:U7 snRNA-associated Sm-like protein LSm10 isoform X2 n=1 Tax=Euwallacea fornicatus TaxID=995702 RepID=UPI00338D4641